jgi:photosystem II stability/assembly factor-like uncharacterized protein
MKTLNSFLVLFLLVPSLLFAQKKSTENEPKINSDLVSGLKFRSIGPAFASGRIADFAVNPNNFSEYYVAVASGNIWKTVNNGTTFEPIFDKYGAYSIGCLAIDPNNTNVIWAGTGENNHQRALGYGDGVYKSLDGGKNWENMGLKESRQIGMIAIDPRNSNIVFVAAEGSVWGPGGDRGLYKTTDGGKNWKKVLTISENTGVNNVKIDPCNPDIMYATAEQRRRHHYTKIGGGPESTIYKSEDAGENWRKIDKGLPTEHMGGIGIDVSPVNSNYIYAIIEAANDAGGFFRSTDRGETWDKMSDHSASGQYYNEIYCDPVDVNKVYSMETFSHFTTDGGKTWKRISTKDRHVDDHAIWINPKNTKHYIIGGDGGVYTTYDDGETFVHVSNLPVIQYYRVTVDNSEPFYWVYGGTQDNNSNGGPNASISKHGVTKDEWVVTLGGDGFWTRVDPTDPNIVYSEYQYGNIYRYDKKSGERTYIKPFPGKDELTHRWNWNAPMIISPHSSSRLYIAANKLFRSENKGDSWKTISGDLTAQIDRNTWPVMGKYWSYDAVVKDVSTSQFNIIVSLDESPVKEDLIYVGTDDGVIQVTENAGETWTKITSFPGVPEYTYVSDVFASKFDENVVFATFDNMKRDDFKPYILKSTDKGKSWKMITNGLPNNGTVHTLEQDHVNENLLFAGTEFGIFFTIDGGSNWVQLKAGIPSIAVKDLAIQKRENDLVLATFGRGFYILDNYTPLRELTEQTVDKEAYLFPVKEASTYIQSSKKYGQGATDYYGKNPEFGATFTYFLKDVPKTKKQIRHEKEKELFEKGAKIPQISWEEARQESLEVDPYLLFTVKDLNGNIVRRIATTPAKGINRINWDLKYHGATVIKLKDDKFDPLKKMSSGQLVLPAEYTVSLGKVVNDVYTELAGPVTFGVKPLQKTTLPAPNITEMVAFLEKAKNLEKKVDGARKLTDSYLKHILKIKQAILETPELKYEVMEKALAIEKTLNNIIFQFEGVEPKASFEEVPPAKFPIEWRMYTIMEPHYESTSAITQTQKDSYDIVVEELKPILEKLNQIGNTELKELEKILDAAGAPWTPGRLPKLD